MKKTLLLIFIFCLNSVFADDLQSAIKLLESKNYAQGLGALREIEAGGGFDDSLYGWLGIALYETGDFAQAIEYFEKMAEIKFSDKAKWHFNAGCAALRQNDKTAAENYFSKSILANKKFSKSYLNRANLRAAERDFSGAASDYEKYLHFEKDCPQRAEIEEIVAALKQAASEEPEKSKNFGTKIFPPEN